MTPYSSLLLLPAIYACVAVADTTGTHTLDLVPDVPTVTVAPQPAGRHFFDLPSLEYAFQVEARCGRGWEPQSLSLNIADSRISQRTAALRERADQPIRLTIPAKQISPIVMRDFCVIEETQEGSTSSPQAQAERDTRKPRQMTVDAALSAHASLRCGNGEDEEMIYVTLPLGVTLHCESPAASGVQELSSR